MRLHYIIKIVVVSMLFALTSSAQTGWRWGVGSNVYGTSGADIETWPTVADRDGNVFLSGIITGWADSAVFGPHKVYNPFHYTQMVVTKADTAGNYQWAVGTQGTNVFPVSMATDADGNLYLLGKYENMYCVIGADTLVDSSHYMMCFLVKISPTGHVLWSKNVAPQANAGGLGVDSAGAVYVSGSFYMANISIGGTVLTNSNPSGGTSGYGGSADAFLVKYDSSGNALWAKSFGGDTTDYPQAMTVAPNGTIYLSGHYYSPSINVGTYTLAGTSATGGRANFLVRYDANGNCDWVKSMNEHINVTAMTTNEQESIFMTGSIDTGIVEAGYYLYHFGKQDMYLSKYNAAGTAVWARSAGGSQTDIANSIALDLCGNLWVSGQMSSVNGIIGYSMILESFRLNEPPWSYDPMFVAWYDTLGGYKTSMALPSGGDDESGIAIDNRGNFYLGGDFQAVMTFGSNVLTPAGHELGFMAKYHYDSAVCHSALVLDADAIKENKGISLYPNPAYDLCTIQSNTVFPPGTKAEFFDVTGRYVGTFPLAGSKETIALDTWQAGIYQCRIISGDGIIVRKLAVIK